MASSRETSRDALAIILQAQMVGTGKPVQAVYNYQAGDFFGQSPVIEVTPSGTRRQRMTRAGSRATFFLFVTTFVLYSDGADWNEDDAIDALDSIEALLADVLDDNQVTVNWQALDYADRSNISAWVIGGLPYIGETVEVSVEVFS